MHGLHYAFGHTPPLHLQLVARYWNYKANFNLKLNSQARGSSSIIRHKVLYKVNELSSQMKMIQLGAGYDK